ncbi:hypothetical protein [Stutzerimonas nitrititolerans]|uniref:hypothetical protein n=1 Tax=Stutzerimonas nitrititolerans TaxID=2482751 RepID=UPI0028A5AFB7|nr:hypothetical protein [Stutzerimonas nitrititolerans]
MDRKQVGKLSQTPRIGLGYLTAMYGGLLCGLAAFGLTLFELDRSGNLPPPAFSNNLCVDEKLNFLRDQPVASPDLLVIGSSVAWRHVDGDELVKSSPTTKPLNGAFCGLFANQSVYVGNWLLDREPTIRRVVMVVDPQDFAGCWKVPDSVFNRDDADAYVYGQTPRWTYYVRYFAPVSLVRNALSVKEQRNGQNEWDPLVFNQHGDGPLVTKNSRRLVYGKPDPLDHSCFEALTGMAERLQREARKFTVVSTPLHPEWKSKYDPNGTFLADFDLRIKNSLSQSDARYWNADKELETPAGDFVDAIHLRWSAAQRFSAALAERLYLSVPPIENELMVESGLSPKP